MITSNLERSFHGLNIAQHNYKIFLDESGGNIGKLKHTPNDKKGSNFNRTISSHIGVPPVFVLGGIAQISNANLIAPDWRKLLHLQNKELKFSKIGKNFFNKLGSKELRKVLEWINENNLCIHFALYDWVYFYDVDIIDSALIESDVCSVWKYLSEKIGNSNRYKEIKDYQRKVGLDKQSDDIIYLFYIKELLHDFIINNLQWFLSEIYNNHYKKIDNQEKTVFLDNLYNMIKGSEKYKVLEF
ncbi:TPA: hypothetical protein RSV79_002082, partial [Mannheimia haemolytica]|nr:hypothetical protein [Mannheimia haemolytica]